VVASFLVGMIHSVSVGLKILGFGVAAGVALLFLLTLILFLGLLHSTEEDKKKGLIDEQVKQQIPIIGYCGTY
jgi:hypothetical protein